MPMPPTAAPRILALLPGARQPDVTSLSRGFFRVLPLGCREPPSSFKASKLLAWEELVGEGELRGHPSGLATTPSCRPGPPVLGRSTPESPRPQPSPGALRQGATLLAAPPPGSADLGTLCARCPTARTCCSSCGSSRRRKSLLCLGVILTFTYF